MDSQGNSECTIKYVLWKSRKEVRKEEAKPKEERDT
jgi:hypothetical protein